MLQIVAMGLGWDPAKAKGGEPIYGSIDPGDGLSIAELATRIRPPGPGGDTLAASREVMKLMATEGRA